MRLVDSVRDEDTVARLGGDEFVVVLPEIEAIEDATIIADRMLAQLGRVFVLGGHDVRISCSIGITLGSEGSLSADEVLRQADLAMYQAKSLGPGRYRIYDKDMQEHVTRTLALDAELRRALDRKEFVVHYQPVVDAGTGLVRGFEALVRWRHPVRGLLPPAEFIPAAEERGFIEAIGSWVLSEVCRQLREWRERYPDSEALQVSVNLSAPEFLRIDLVDEVRRAIDRHGIPPGVLRLELGERALSANPELTVGTLERLREMGIHVAIDDFGRGVYSWSYLGRTPVDSLKIPRDLLAAPADGQNGARRLTTVAQCLGLQAVAEGVETQDELSACRAAGSELAQGFLFWRPLDPDEASELLAGGSVAN